MAADLASAPRTVRQSPFIDAGHTTSASSLAILHLRRDQLIPTILQDPSLDINSEYTEGHVTNTRFGSYPHSTLLDVPWGSQVLASAVDTGSKGQGKSNRKRKLDETGDSEIPLDEHAQDEPKAKNLKAAVTAASGFCHVLPPTPETWTMSLPHRTQVVYTPDYSYIIQKLKVRPGSVVIEAGAGSGSFTHAAARAVHDGMPPELAHETDSGEVYSSNKRQGSLGRVYSFEYHEQRTAHLQTEIHAHGLDPLVHITHRDVYQDGFMVSRPSGSPSSVSPSATAVFLDLPSPWKAIPHLKRSQPSPLSPDHAVHLCCFLPCIEQVQRAVSTLRQYGWVEINMQELQHRRLEVRREKVGLEWEGLRGVNASPKDVNEAIQRLKEVKSRSREARPLVIGNGDGITKAPSSEVTRQTARKESKAERLARVAKEATERKTFNEGKLVHRTEPEIKNHTSYLVFAVLPMDWTKDSE